jgi:hypothetical protein
VDSAVAEAEDDEEEDAAAAEAEEVAAEEPATALVQRIFSSGDGCPVSFVAVGPVRKPFCASGADEAAAAEALPSPTFSCFCCWLDLLASFLGAAVELALFWAGTGRADEDEAAGAAAEGAALPLAAEPAALLAGAGADEEAVTVDEPRVLGMVTNTVCGAVSICLRAQLRGWTSPAGRTGQSSQSQRQTHSHTTVPCSSIRCPRSFLFLPACCLCVLCGVCALANGQTSQPASREL